jgi:hypothetical protein
MFKPPYITTYEGGYPNNVMQEIDRVANAVTKAKEERMIRDRFKIKKVIFNKPATIVFWEDGTKTVVKASGENFDKEKGLAMAITKKILGLNKGNYNNIFKKWCKEENND